MSMLFHYAHSAKLIVLYIILNPGLNKDSHFHSK